LIGCYIFFLIELSQVEAKMVLKNKIILFIVVVVICLAAQSYDNYTERLSKSALDHIDLLID